MKLLQFLLSYLVSAEEILTSLYGHPYGVLFLWGFLSSVVLTLTGIIFSCFDIAAG